MKMIQQQMITPGIIKFREIDVPKAGPGEIVVRTQMIGICGSDIHVYHGKHHSTPYPVTQGHEISADIVEIGEGVEGFEVGQKVTIEPQVVCGHCHPCRNGKYNLCESLKVMGFQTPGTASEYFAVDDSKIPPIPQNMSFECGAMIEPLAVAVHAINRFHEGIEGKKVVVLGAGPIGNLVAQAAKGMGAAEVMITDVSDFRLELASKCGIDYTVNTLKQDFNTAMIEAFGPDKADVIYDCAGNNITMNQAIRCARKGSTIILVAVFADMATVDLAILNDHELDLNTSMMYRHEDYVEAIELVNAGKINLQELQSKVYPFAKYQEAYEFIEANRETTMKVLINVQDQEGIVLE